MCELPDVAGTNDATTVLDEPATYLFLTCCPMMHALQHCQVKTADKYIYSALCSVVFG